MTLTLGVSELASVVPVNELPACRDCGQRVHATGIDCDGTGTVSPEALIGAEVNLIRPGGLVPREAAGSFCIPRRPSRLIGVATIAGIAPRNEVVFMDEQIDDGNGISTYDHDGGMGLWVAMRDQPVAEAPFVALLDPFEPVDPPRDWIPCPEHDEHREIGGIYCQRCDGTGSVPPPDVAVGELRAC